MFSKRYTHTHTHTLPTLLVFWVTVQHLQVKRQWMSVVWNPPRLKKVSNILPHNPTLNPPPTTPVNPNTRLTWCYVCLHSASGLRPDAFLKSYHINRVDTYIYIYILYIYISMSGLIGKSNGMTLVIYIYILYILHGIQQVVHQVTWRTRWPTPLLVKV